MARVIGLGGLFFKSADTAATCEWYARVLGIEFQDWGGTVFLPETAAAHPGAGTVFSPFKAETDYFAPSEERFMFNLMVDDLTAMLARCAEHGVEPTMTMFGEMNGDFAHVMDCDGRKVELWQPRPMR
ncbi:Glyoxalase-like domain protein [Tsuneonella dongtanensis]|uniref:Glyoxalase-like domain protein n=1 Tax=Tsuneonella dongtanensis TaxID=692370 RepID=A0A1B2AAY8_9SPHN|nr:VOC family protein [Tsuneonella dongtanensis]ANY19306.1 Glyoxalase-like domain protein [Tsuneonella dongtanensis]